MGGCIKDTLNSGHLSNEGNRVPVPEVTRIRSNTVTDQTFQLSDAESFQCCV